MKYGNNCNQEKVVYQSLDQTIERDITLYKSFQNKLIKLNNKKEKNQVQIDYVKSQLEQLKIRIQSYKNKMKYFLNKINNVLE